MIKQIDKEEKEFTLDNEQDEEVLARILVDINVIFTKIRCKIHSFYNNKEWGKSNIGTIDLNTKLR